VKYLVALVIGLLVAVIAYDLLREAEDMYDPYAIPFGELTWL